MARRVSCVATDRPEINWLNFLLLKIQNSENYSISIAGHLPVWEDRPDPSQRELIPIWNIWNVECEGEQFVQSVMWVTSCERIEVNSDQFCNCIINQRILMRVRDSCVIVVCVMVRGLRRRDGGWWGMARAGPGLPLLQTPPRGLNQHQWEMKIKQKNRIF